VDTGPDLRFQQAATRQDIDPFSPQTNLSGGRARRPLSLLGALLFLVALFVCIFSAQFACLYIAILLSLHGMPAL